MEFTHKINFEIEIHNVEVRQKVAEGEHHKQLSDDWADTRYIEIEANNKEQARARIEVNYPSAQGFVIDEILEIYR